MKKLLKVAVISALLLSIAPSIQAQEIYSSKAAITANSEPTTNAEVQSIIREVAIEKGIPAEILKAIAFVETNMNQYKSDGTPNISTDGGIGIMQLTLSAAEISQYNINVERLKTDTRYNIEQGADLLIRKWNNPNLPLVNHHEKEKIEDWYFAIMAYNGLSKRNDPNVSGSQAYQEEVFQVIRDKSLLQVGQTPKLDIRYPDAARPDLMVFPDGVQYEWPTNTKTTQNYKVNDVAYTFHRLGPEFGDASNLRDEIKGPVTEKILHYTPVRIIGGPYETATNLHNHYIFYKVKGTGFEGYMASANLVTSKDVTFFTDIANKEVLRAVTYLQSRKTINGYADGTYRPNEKLLRYHAAKLIVQSLGLTAPAGYKMKATDMKPGNPGYEFMLIAEANGIMGAGGTLKPYQPLTRSEMASILVRAFSNVYANPPAGYQFAGISATDPNVREINKLAYNNITNSIPYNRNNTVDRGQYALFLQRSVKLKESKN